MSQQVSANPSDVAGNGFWRLSHDDLAAVLACRDLKGRTLRVYLALADLTRGYQKERDVVSIGQIAERAGMYAIRPDGTKEPDYPHVCDALRALAAKGLYGQADAQGQSKVRWVVWPPPAVPAIAKAGSITTADCGNGTTAKATARTGKHQDTKNHKKIKKAVPAQEVTMGNICEGACGLMALWVDSFRQRVGRDFPASGKGQLAGTLKAMLAGTSETDLAAFIGRWFAVARKDYGIALFKGKVEGGDAELVGRGDAQTDYNDPIALRNGQLLAQEAGE